MHSITIALADCPAPWTLLYKTTESAIASWNAYTSCQFDAEIVLSDDFGQAALVQRSRVAGALFEDLDQSMMAHIERGLHQARTQAKANSIGMNDPVLKTARMTQGPGIFQPMGNGQMPGH